MTYNVFGGTLSLTQSINQSINPKDHSARCLTACDSVLSSSHFIGRYHGNLLHSRSTSDCG